MRTDTFSYPNNKEINSYGTRFYTYHKDGIFNKIHDLIEEYQTHIIFIKIIFANNSVFTQISGCVISNFSTHNPKNIGKFKDETYLKITQ
ncbi:hypothetical protein HN451_00615 [archaeon]|nr:hypothetical protein [archaeon]